MVKRGLPRGDEQLCTRTDSRVMAASPAHVFAMKARAARTRDIDDLRLLADIIGVNSADTALRICADFYPDEPVSPRSAAVLQELFD